MIPIVRKSKSEIAQLKIYDLESLVRIRAVNKFAGKKVVFISGVFDVMNGEQLEIINNAADQGDFLIIGLNSDVSVFGIIGKDKLVNDESVRSLILASMQVVNAIILFDEEIPSTLIAALTPDVII